MASNNTGTANASNVADDYAQLSFMIQQITGHMATGALVRVEAVNPGSGLAPVGYLDCKPLVTQMDGAGNAVEHGTLYNVPYFRLQGGKNAVVIDPAEGDIGFAVFASHDTSRVKNTREEGLPATRRRFDWSDGFYLGGFLNGTPENYIRFDEAGDIHLKPASKVYIDGDAAVTGNLDVDGEVKAGGIPLSTHKHTGVTTGGGTSGAPIA